MRNFDEGRYLRIESGAVALAGPLDRLIKGEISNGVENIFFSGTGGVAFLMQPAVELLQARSNFPTYTVKAAELVLTDHVHLNNRSLIIFPSVSGTTKESIAAMNFAKKKGAKVLCLTGQENSPLASGADHNFSNFVEDDTSSESFYLQSLFIALSIMDNFKEIENYKEIISEIELLPNLLIEVKRAFEPFAKKFADEIANEQNHIFTGAGGAWHEAWYYAMCILEEMQWIWTRPVHASDFFHGTLELVEKDTSLIIFKGEDAARPLVDRVERFARTISEKVRVFDTKDFLLPGISDATRSYLSPVILAAIFERVSAHLEIIRDHPLTTRRYYKKTDL